MPSNASDSNGGSGHEPASDASAIGAPHSEEPTAADMAENMRKLVASDALIMMQRHWELGGDEATSTHYVHVQRIGATRIEAFVPLALELLAAAGIAGGAAPAAVATAAPSSSSSSSSNSSSSSAAASMPASADDVRLFLSKPGFPWVVSKELRWRTGASSPASAGEIAADCTLLALLVEHWPPGLPLAIVYSLQRLPPPPVAGAETGDAATAAAGGQA